MLGSKGLCVGVENSRLTSNCALDFAVLHAKPLVHMAWNSINTYVI